MIFGTLLTTGCRQNDDNKVFTAVIPDYNGPKDYIAGSTVFWNSADRIRINDGIYTVALDANDHNKATVDAEGVSDYNGDYYAAYPADISSIVSAARITFALPHEEVYTSTSEGQVIHSVMAAKANNNVLQFQNVCALLHFSVAASGSGIGAKLRSLEVIADQPMWGDITAEYNAGQWHVTSVTGADNTSRTLRFDTPLTLNSTPQDIYLVVPPVSNARTFTLRLTIDDGTVKVFEKSKEVTFSFASGYLYHFDDTNTYTSSGMKFGDSDPSATVTNGSEEHPYLIYSSENWTNLASAMTTADTHITLVNDISVSSTLSGDFRAILDGNGHTITLTTQNISLFSTVNGGTVKNLTLAATNDVTEPVLVAEGNTYTNKSYGSLACYASSNSIFENCTNTINVTCYYTASSVSIGGLFGTANNCTITNCTNHGNISSNAMNIGGIIGKTGNIISLNSCNNFGNIILTSSTGTISTKYCGGIVGILALSNNNNYVYNCINQGNITFDKASSEISYIGGVFGQASCNIKECINTGSIICNTTTNTAKYIGGIIAENTAVATERLINNCYNEGNISTAANTLNAYVGGIIATEKRTSIKNCYAFCNLQGSYVAGIVAFCSGLFRNTSISNCYFYGVLTCSSTNKYSIAGTPSDSYKFQIDHCYYPYGLSMCHSSNTDNGYNATLSSATTLSDSSSLATALHNNLPNMPDGSYDWQNSTSGPAHVVFVTGSK